ncbi:hypothetical protein B0H14DRAFT_2565176 [Mycena olivaceomarginata]|nr:hypothetical protein B0H14DRAFT_2565176 [Mycena olivaceomarginata]
MSRFDKYDKFQRRAEVIRVANAVLPTPPSPRRTTLHASMFFVINNTNAGSLSGLNAGIPREKKKNLDQCRFFTRNKCNDSGHKPPSGANGVQHREQAGGAHSTPISAWKPPQNTQPRSPPVPSSEGNATPGIHSDRFRIAPAEYGATTNIGWSEEELSDYISLSFDPSNHLSQKLFSH